MAVQGRRTARGREASAQIGADRAATRGIETPSGCYLYCYCLYILAIDREIGNSVIKYNGLSLSVKYRKGVTAKGSYCVYVKLDRRRRTW
jgi:hypothetical protein